MRFVPVALAFSLLAGGSLHADPRELATWLERKPTKVRKVNGILYFPQPGREVNFGREGLRWTGPGDCDSQREAQSVIMELQGPRVTVRGGYIIEAPDGVHVKNADCVIDGMIFPDVCEDAITADGADRLVIRNCVFRGAADKAIQLNRGRDILIENCYFEDCAKPVRVKAGVTVTVRNCYAKNSAAFVLADGEGAEARVENNRVDGAKYFVEAKKGAVIRVGAGNVTSGVRFPDAATGGAIIRRE